MFAFPAIVLGVEHSGLAFLAGAGICFVGAAPAFKEDMEGTVHVVGALTGVIGGLLFMLVTGLWYVAIITLALMGVVLLIPALKKNKTWWLELVAFYGYAVAVGLLNF